MKNFIKKSCFLATFLIAFFQLQLQAQSNKVSVQPQKGFIITGTNNGIYSVNANTGTMKLITNTGFTTKYANSLSIDTIRGNIYYTQNCNDTITYGVYGYNYRTNTHFTLTTDFRTATGSPTVAHGMGTGGACFYNGEIYIGSESARAIPSGPTYQSGGKTFFPFSNIIHKITLNTTGTFITNTTVFKDYFNDHAEISYWSEDGLNVGTYDSDWGDFTVINDTLFERVGNDISDKTSNAYLMSAPANRIYHLQTSTDNAISFTQVADDGYRNLIYMNDPEGNQQRLVYGNKTNGTYNTTTTIPMTLGGVAYTSIIADATSVYKGEGNIGNTVWHDNNANGKKDAGEYGIANAPIELWEDLDNNNLINITTDKLVGTALTNNAGHYGFTQVLLGNYLMRAVRTTSVNYPAQGFSGNYPFNELANAGVTLTNAGDETIVGNNNINLIAKDYPTVVFTDNTADFGFTGTFTVYVRNVSGNVFNDPDGGNVNHSSNTANNVPANMYANIFNATTGIVEDTAIVNTNGTYNFINIPEDDYQIQISNTKGIIGTVIPSFPTPYAYGVSWATTGHFNGAENMGKDGSGVVSNMFTVGSSDVSNINFGVQRRPLSAFNRQPTILNPGGVTDFIFPTDAFYVSTPGYAGIPNIADVSAFASQDYDGGTVNRLRVGVSSPYPLFTKINTISVNGIRYRENNTPASIAICPTCPIFPGGGVLTNFINGVGLQTPISIDPKDGNDTVRIYYLAEDNLGTLSSNTGITRVDFTTAVLSVKIESFIATAKENAVLLNWVFKNETINSKYEVEASTDGTNFKNIGSVLAININNYNMVHNNPVFGINYYRIKIIENDGSIFYSEIRKVNIGKKQEINIFPNPANGSVNVEINSAHVNKAITILIVAMDGKILQTKNITNASQIETINVSALAVGKYILTIKNNNEVINKTFEVIR